MKYHSCIIFRSPIIIGFDYRDANDRCVSIKEMMCL